MHRAWWDLHSWPFALEGGHTAHVDSIRRSTRIRPWPRVVYLPCLGVLLSVLTVSRSGHQRLSRRRFSWRLRRIHHSPGPLQRNRADRRFLVWHGAVILTICLKVTEMLKEGAGYLDWTSHDFHVRIQWKSICTLNRLSTLPELYGAC